eukprot:2157448-Pleurochrysis_carterae.AAC.1
MLARGPTSSLLAARVLKSTFSAMRQAVGTIIGVWGSETGIIGATGRDQARPLRGSHALFGASHAL